MALHETNTELLLLIITFRFSKLKDDVRYLSDTYALGATWSWVS